MGARGGGEGWCGIAKRELVQVKGFAFSATLYWIGGKKEAHFDTDFSLLTVNVERLKEEKEEIRKERKLTD
jgi:hypothetical protein